LEPIVSLRKILLVLFFISLLLPLSSITAEQIIQTEEQLREAGLLKEMQALQSKESNNQVLVPDITVKKNTEKNKNNWIVNCKDLGKGKQYCAMVQRHTNPESNAALMQIEITKAPANSNFVARVLVALPLDLLLTAGIGVKIDEGKIDVVPFHTCSPTGCVSGFYLDKKRFKEFKNGGTLAVYFTHVTGKSLHVDGSLWGFTKAFDQL